MVVERPTSARTIAQAFRKESEKRRSAKGLPPRLSGGTVRAYYSDNYTPGQQAYIDAEGGKITTKGLKNSDVRRGYVFYEGKVMSRGQAERMIAEKARSMKPAVAALYDVKATSAQYAEADKPLTRKVVEERVRKYISPEDIEKGGTLISAGQGVDKLPYKKKYVVTKVKESQGEEVRFSLPDPFLMAAGIKERPAVAPSVVEVKTPADKKSLKLLKSKKEIDDALRDIRNPYMGRDVSDRKYEEFQEGVVGFIKRADERGRFTVTQRQAVRDILRYNQELNRFLGAKEDSPIMRTNKFLEKNAPSAVPSPADVYEFLIPQTTGQLVTDAFLFGLGDVVLRPVVRGGKKLFGKVGSLLERVSPVTVRGGGEELGVKVVRSAEGEAFGVKLLPEKKADDYVITLQVGDIGKEGRLKARQKRRPSKVSIRKASMGIREYKPNKVRTSYELRREGNIYDVVKLNTANLPKKGGSLTVESSTNTVPLSRRSARRNPLPGEVDKTLINVYGTGKGGVVDITEKRLSKVTNIENIGKGAKRVTIIDYKENAPSVSFDLVPRTGTPSKKVRRLSSQFSQNIPERTERRLVEDISEGVSQKKAKQILKAYRLEKRNEPIKILKSPKKNKGITGQVMGEGVGSPSYVLSSEYGVGYGSESRSATKSGSLDAFGKAYERADSAPGGGIIDLFDRKKKGKYILIPDESGGTLIPSNEVSGRAKEFGGFRRGQRERLFGKLEVQRNRNVLNELPGFGVDLPRPNQRTVSVPALDLFGSQVGGSQFRTGGRLAVGSVLGVDTLFGTRQGLSFDVGLVQGQGQDTGQALANAQINVSALGLRSAQKTLLGQRQDQQYKGVLESVTVSKGYRGKGRQGRERRNPFRDTPLRVRRGGEGLKIRIVETPKRNPRFSGGGLPKIYGEKGRGKKRGLYGYEELNFKIGGIRL